MRSLIAPAIAVNFILATTCAARADDKPLIWSPSKLSDTAYTARIGLRLPDYAFASVGAELGVNSPTVGGPVTTPVNLWANVKMQSVKTPAYQLNRQLNIRLDTIDSQFQAEMTSTRREIVNEDLDLEFRRDIIVNYDKALGAWSDVTASQTVRLSSPITGSAIAISANSNDNFSHIGSALSLEQRLGKRIRVSGGLSQQNGESPVPRFNARYNIHW